MEDRDDGQKYDLEVQGHASGSTLPIHQVEDDRPRRSRGSMIRKSAVRAKRFARWVLGPSTPSPDPDLPRPTPSSSISFTLGTHSSRILLDPPLTRLTRSLRLRRALIPFILLCVSANILLIRQQYYTSAPPIIPSSAALWGNWPPDTCGLNATGCADRLEEGTYRCMGRCRDVTLGNPRWVGGEKVDDVPLVIGGGDGSHTYRADSWVCPSALHAGLISPTLGGCITLTPLPYPGGASSFPSSTANGLTSTPFAPHFPGAFILSANTTTTCRDIHPVITGFNAFCLLLTTLFLAPAPAVLFSILVILGYSQIVLFSNPPHQPLDWSPILGGLLPVILSSYWIYHTSFRRTLHAFKGLPFELAWWQGVGYWLSIENSTIFAKLPISRLGYGELSVAGVITLVVIIGIVIVVVGVQAWQMRKGGLLQHYLVRYLSLVPILIVLANIPHYTLRLHHYLFTLAALPVLSLPNRVSLFGQAFAFGMFLDGVGRWGWDSILENTGSLLGDAAAGTGSPIFSNSSTADVLVWLPMNTSWVPSNTTVEKFGFNGVSILVDDIQRLVNYTQTTLPLSNLTLENGIEHFFRLAWTVNGTSLDYTDPATLASNGAWLFPKSHR